MTVSQQQQGRQQHQQPDTAAAAAAPAAVAAAATAAYEGWCHSSSESTFGEDTLQQQQQQQQQQRQQQEEALVAAAVTQALLLIPSFFDISPGAAAAAAPAPADDSAYDDQQRGRKQQQQQQQQQQLLQGELLRGGTTNTIVRISRSSKSSPCCLVKFYGRSTSLWIDRERECAVLRLLGKQPSSKKLLAHFDGGVIESWVEGAPLKPEQLHRAAAAVAAALAALHGVALDPLIPETALISEFDEKGLPASSLWTNLNKFLEVGLREKQKAGAPPFLQFVDFDFLTKAAAFLEMHSKNRGPVLLSHGDLLAGNIIQQADGSVCFIDFEYAAAMERGFDIANHFVEYGGFECEWSRIPSRADQAAFLRVYVQQLAATAAATAAAAEDVEQQVELLLEEIKPFFAVSHLFWGLWALVQAANSTVDFNFPQYASRRLEEARKEIAKLREDASFGGMF